MLVLLATQVLRIHGAVAVAAATLATVVQAALEPAQVWVCTRGPQPAAARTAARIASSSPSRGTLPSMRSPST